MKLSLGPLPEFIQIGRPIGHHTTPLRQIFRPIVNAAYPLMGNMGKLALYGVGGMRSIISIVIQNMALDKSPYACRERGKACLVKWLQKRREIFMAKVMGCPIERTGAIREVRPPCRVESGQVHLKKGGG